LSSLPQLAYAGHLWINIINSNNGMALPGGQPNCKKEPDMTKTRYYLACECSDALAKLAEDTLENYRNNDPAPQEAHFERMVDLLVPEVLDGFLIRTCDIVGIGPTASKVVHGAADTITSTVSALSGRLLRKRSNEELRPLAGFVAESHLAAADCSRGINMTGTELEKSLYDQMRRVNAEVQAGRIAAVREELNSLMPVLVDRVLDGLMKRPISLMHLNLVMRKMTDLAIGTCRGAGHLVVNRVFRKLEDEQLVRLVNYFDGQLVTAERPQ
jgi:hypothetical protein